MQYKHFTGYDISPDGYVININRRKPVKPQLNNCGYLRVQLCSASEKPRFFVHRLVAELYIPNPGNLPQVNHIDGNKLNNSVTNLEWCTSSQNHKHAFDSLGRKPTKVFGNDNGQSKITLEQINLARSLVASGQLVKDVAELLGVHRKYLGSLLSGRVKRAA